MECPDIPPMKEPITCREMPTMSLEERRQLLERQAWINNVKRVLGMILSMEHTKENLVD